jgi:2,3,4,5-tetrahydropyridine-2-carboxylate N-succinyltransferase
VGEASENGDAPGTGSGQANGDASPAALRPRWSLCGRSMMDAAADPQNGESGMSDLERRIRELAEERDPSSEAVRAAVDELLARLESGEVRAAEKTAAGWRANEWVKAGILLAFRVGKIVELAPAGPLAFSDRDTLPPRRMPAGVRVVPGGSAVRRGAYLGPGVVIMPPAYVNVGAYVGAGTMIDSHALVGSCAQIGARVHLSAGAQIGGVLEPVGARPAVVEDDAFIGALAGVFEGAVVGRGAVLAAGVILTASTPVYDLVRSEVHRGTREEPLVVPERAVLVPGSRPASGDFAAEHAISLMTPVIVKYRDEKTDAATVLESALR